MDLGVLVIGSLIGAGTLLNPQKEPRDQLYKKRPTNKFIPNGTNIYNSKDFDKVKAEEASRVRSRFDLSRDPVKTNVIPMYFNTLSIKQDSEKIPNSKYDKKRILKVLDSLDADTMNIINSASIGSDNSGIVPSSRDNEHSGLIRPDQIGGSLLPDQKYEDFTHNNMVPFYGGKIKQNMNPNNRLVSDKLERYTGQYKLNQKQKQETPAFFKPIKGISNIHGSHEKRDMSRYNPNNTGKKNNELPFNQTIVGPGLNKGYTSKPSGGFHEQTRIMPKKLTELRIDPVLEQKGRINAGKALTQNRTSIAKLSQNQPSLFVENKNGERNFKTTGAVKARRVRPKVILRHTNRKKSKFLINPAKAAGISKPYNTGTYKKSNRINHINTPYRNAQYGGGGKFNDFGKTGYKNRPNERAVSGIKSHILNPKSWINAIQKYFDDPVKKTRKEFYSVNRYQKGYFGSQQPGALPAYDPNHVAKTTIRETTENNDHIGHVGYAVRRGHTLNGQSANTTIRETTENNDHNGHVGYAVRRGHTLNGQSANTTIRETTENNDHNGNVGYAVRRGHTLNGQSANTTIRETTENNEHIGHVGYAVRRGQTTNGQSAKTTIRETTENKRHKGWIGTNGVSKIQSKQLDLARTTGRETIENDNHVGISASIVKKQIAYDPNHVAKTTIRETTEEDDHVGISASIVKKQIAYDPNHVARTTIRETTENDGHVGISNGIKKQITYDPNDVAKTTIKETTEINNHTGNVQAKQSATGKGYLTTKWKANNTNRQFTSDYDYYGVAQSNSKKTKSYKDAYNAETNTLKEKIACGRQPKGHGAKVSNNHVNMETKKIDTDRKNMRAGINHRNIGHAFYPVNITSDKNHLPQHDIRLDTALTDAYKKNPLTHTLNSYA